MIPDPILIGLGTLVVAGLIYFARLQREKMRHALEDHADRVRRVVDAYMRLCRSRPPAARGPDGLHKAGIATLKTNAEVQEVIDLIVAQGEDHPLGDDHAAVFQEVDLLKLFKFAVDRGTNFTRVRMQDLIRDSGARL